METVNYLGRAVLKFEKVSEPIQTVKMTSSSAVQKFARSIWEHDLELQESVYILALNNSNEVIAHFMASLGGLTGSVIDSRTIFTRLLKVPSCTAFIVLHNHPSGNSNPSDNDIAITKKLIAGAEILSLKLLDHIILMPQDDKYTSFLDSGYM